MAVLIFVNVVLHAFHKDLAWLTELGELMMVWVTFLGGAAASQRGAHMCINEFLDKLDAGRRRWADAAVQLFTMSIFAVVLYLRRGHRAGQLGHGIDHARVAHGLAVHAFAGGLGAHSPVHRVGPDPDLARCSARAALPL
jgi:hypothetical protein